MFSVTNKVLDSDADSFIQAHGGAKDGDTCESVPSLPGKSLLVVTSYRQTVTVVYHRKEVNLMVLRSMTPELKTAMIETMKLILEKI